MADPEADPEAEAVPEAGAATSQPASAAASLTWLPPPGFADYVSHYSVKAIQGVVIAFGLLALVTLVLWGVPTVAVARSEAYAVACEEAVKSGTIRTLIGRDATAEAVPVRYRLDGEQARFTFVVRGGLGRAVVESQVQGGRVVRQRPHLAIDWTRPLRPQLEPWDRP